MRGRVLATRQYMRRPAIRKLVAVARQKRLPNLAHLAVMHDGAWGPVQPDEALLLHALVRTTRPLTIVEVGFLRGVSAMNFLAALDDDARLYCFDVTSESAKHASSRFDHDPRFRFVLKSQTDLAAADVDCRPVDFVFIDAAHRFDLNQQTFERLVAMLSPQAIVAVHDTGTVAREHVPSGHWWLQSDDGWVGNEREVESEEREFVNWVLDAHPEFAQIHLHTTKTPRCGLTLLQRSQALPRPASRASH